MPSVVAQSSYKLALPGYRYSFPHDHFNHPDFATEWWYYTGNLQSGDGHRFGFELTFFRQAVTRGSSQQTAWDLRDIYPAHLALSDLTSGRFYFTERTQRAGPGLAGADEVAARIWNGNWEVRWDNNADQILNAVTGNFELHFTLHAEKPPVIQGENGISPKGPEPGRASHYISLTRLDTRGKLLLAGKSYEVTGLSWMDHEFFTAQLAPGLIGWDWLSLQLDDRSELMLFHLRRKDGTIDSFSSGTWVDPQGRVTHLRNADFTLEPAGETWKSQSTGAVYPVRWKIAVPKLGIVLDAQTPLASQELAGTSKLMPSYWEGAIKLNGSRGARPLIGRGYLEMTGYAEPVNLAP
jgi:predicted secreted hydrolase